jgi:hypothetical protein
MDEAERQRIRDEVSETLRRLETFRPREPQPEPPTITRGLRPTVPDDVVERWRADADARSDECEAARRRMRREERQQTETLAAWVDERIRQAVDAALARERESFLNLIKELAVSTSELGTRSLKSFALLRPCSPRCASNAPPSVGACSICRPCLAPLAPTERLVRNLRTFRVSGRFCRLGSKHGHFPSSGIGFVCVSGVPSNAAAQASTTWLTTRAASTRCSNVRSTIPTFAA